MSRATAAGTAEKETQMSSRIAGWALALIAVMAVAPAFGAIIIDDFEDADPTQTLLPKNDGTGNIPNKAGSPEGAEADGGWYNTHTGGYHDIEIYKTNTYAGKDASFNLTEAVTTLEIVFRNDGADDSTAGTFEITWFTWYDKIAKTETGTAGRFRDNTGYDVTRPVIPAGGTAVAEFDLSNLTRGTGEVFGDDFGPTAGDAVGAMLLEDLFHGALNGTLTYTDLKVEEVRFVPEPATMGLLALGSLGIAALRLRRRGK